MNKRRKTGKRCLALLLTIAMSFTAFAASALAVTQEEIDDLKAEQEEIENKGQELKDKLDALEKEHATLLEKWNALIDEQETIQAGIENLNEQIAAYEVLIEEKAIEAEEAQKKADEQWEKYEERVRAMEENGSISYLSVLFGARNFQDLLFRIDFISEVIRYDEELYQAVVDTQTAAIAAKKSREETKLQFETSKGELQEEMAVLEKSSLESQALLEAMEEDIAEYDAYYKENEAREEEIRQEIEDKMAQFEEENGSNLPGSTGPGSASGFIWPSYTTWVTSRYGWRDHPIYNERRFHHGIDIGANGGTEIWAAAAGTVITSVYSESYGNYVVVYHGNDTATLYAHMSERHVSVGDYVSQGQCIGLVGNTGASKGNHIHYEIQVGGSTVDPLSYY